MGPTQTGLHSTQVDINPGFGPFSHPRIPNSAPLTTLIRCAIAISVTTTTTTMPASVGSMPYDSYDLALAKLRPTTPAYSVRYSKSVRCVEPLVIVLLLTGLLLSELRYPIPKSLLVYSRD